MKDKRHKFIKKIRAKSASLNEILVFRTNKNFYAQLIQNKITIFSISTLNLKNKTNKINLLKKSNFIELGKLFANKYLEVNKILKKPFFNKASYKYGQNLSAFYESFLSNISI